MKQPLTRKAASSGFSMVELAIVIVLMAILSAFAIVSFGGAGEARDASMVQSAQASLQALVSQGAVRQDVRPDSLPTNAVLTAIQATVNQKAGGIDQGVTFSTPGTNQFTMTIKNSKRSATFRTTANGDVELFALNGFQNYSKDTSNAIPTIKKN